MSLSIDRGWSGGPGGSFGGAARAAWLLGTGTWGDTLSFPHTRRCEWRVPPLWHRDKKPVNTGDFDNGRSAQKRIAPKNRSPHGSIYPEGHQGAAGGGMPTRASAGCRGRRVGRRFPGSRTGRRVVGASADRAASHAGPGARVPGVWLLRQCRFAYHEVQELHRSPAAMRLLFARVRDIGAGPIARRLGLPRARQAH